LGKAEAEKIFIKFPNSFPKKRNRFPAFIRPENLILRGRQAPSFLIGPGAPLPSKRKIVGRRFGHGEKLGSHPRIRWKGMLIFLMKTLKPGAGALGKRSDLISSA